MEKTHLLPIFLSEQGHNTRLFLWKIEESEEELLFQLPRQEFYAKEIERLHSVKRKKEKLAARILLHHHLGDEASIAYSSCGKPFLGDSLQKISISHSKEYVLLAFSDQSIGIDIEQISAKPLFVASKYIHKKDFRFSNFSPDFSATLLWSLKEAAFKYFQTSSGDTLQKIIIAKDQHRFLAIYDNPLQPQTAKLSYAKWGRFVIAMAMPQ